MSAFNTFRKKAVTIIIETKQKQDKALIGPLIDGAFGDPKMGNTIPKLVAVSPNDNQIWGRLTYAQLGSSKNLKALTKNLTAIQDRGVIRLSDLQTEPRAIQQAFIYKFAV